MILSVKCVLGSLSLPFFSQRNRGSDFHEDRSIQVLATFPIGISLGFFIFSIKLLLNCIPQLLTPYLCNQHQHEFLPFLYLLYELHSPFQRVGLRNMCCVQSYELVWFCITQPWQSGLLGKLLNCFNFETQSRCSS